MTFRWVEHTSELALEIAARSKQAIFEEALAAFAELVAQHSDEAETGPGGEPETVTRAVELRAPDRAALLAAWLDELIYLAETDRLVPVEATLLELTEDAREAGAARLRASLRMKPGRRFDLVKGATLHALAVAPADAGWRANVVLDV